MTVAPVSRWRENLQGRIINLPLNVFVKNARHEHGHPH